MDNGIMNATKISVGMLYMKFCVDYWSWNRNNLYCILSIIYLSIYASSVIYIWNWGMYTGQVNNP
jgi:hypothetical protein